MSPFRWLARTRTRLAVAAVVAFGLLFGAALPVADYVRHASDSVVGDMGILTLWLFLLLTGSVCLGILLGDQIFPHRWRERVILGESVEIAEPEDPLAPPPLPRSHMLGFSAIVVVLVVVGALAIEAMTGGFFGEYQRVGSKRTILRGDNTELKLDLIGELADKHREPLVRDALELLDMAWRDERQPPEVRDAALVALGQLAGSLVSSVDSWVEEGVRDHWEIDLVRDLRRHVAPDLRDVFESSRPETAAHVARTLGKLRDRESVDLFVEWARQHAEDPGPPWLGAVSALGLIREPAAMKPLSRLAPKVAGDREAFRTLAWAIGEISRHYVPETDDDVDAFYPKLIGIFGDLADDGPIQRRCDAVHVLGNTGHAAIADPLFEAFDAEGAAATCEVGYVDLDAEAPELIAIEEPLRLRILRGLGLVAVGNERVLGWARERQDDEEYSKFIRGQLREVIRMAEASGQ
ncbi:MAG: hypothetical protein ACQEXJ_21300 [Myxococcota bacterium]